MRIDPTPEIVAVLPGRKMPVTPAIVNCMIVSEPDEVVSFASTLNDTLPSSSPLTRSRFRCMPLLIASLIAAVTSSIETIVTQPASPSAELFLAIT